MSSVVYDEVGHSTKGFKAADLCSTANTETIGNHREKRFTLGPSAVTNVIGFEWQ